MDIDELLQAQAEPQHTSTTEINIESTERDDDYLAIDAKHLTLEKFQEAWKTGRPVLVRNTMTESSQNLWSPRTFIKQYGNQQTEVIDCSNGTVKEIKVKEYFGGFENIKKRPDYDPDTNTAPIYKIKDWPPKDDFESCFPEQYRDFMKNLPAKEYCSPSGYYNLSNRVPKSQLPPDLGPKMFIAYGSDVGEAGVGTTKLHNDMADAVNIMCYMYTTDAKPAAVWDIYPYEALDTIREFVTKIAQEQKVKIRDPIHDQWLYLNNEMRERLEKEHGIKSWRIFQNAGDAVFIPAGCAHQVSNYHSAVKCAYDFVSPENVNRCIDLTRQFSRVRREDALQILNTILYTWCDTMF
ncbi:hypothetical protein BX666DRAFT_1860155 [Dichotomocladium elegans]|nr:hypothetical protein BX666DRAFT_1860155 [Dichotomocladium elegans]